jgi:NAD dependent epimerase/dehydratase
MSISQTSSPVFVSGADGFIGSHLTEALVRKGYKVRALVQYNSFNSWGWLDDCPADIKSQIEVVNGDIRDPYAMNLALKGCHTVFHLAALIAIPFSYQSPDLYLETNVKGTLNLLQAARHHGVSRFIHTSTSEVYGTARFVPITELHPLHAQSPYAASKIGADQLVQSFFNSYDLPTITIRPFNTYGPRQSARAVIPTVITQIANQSKRIVLGSISPTRDFSFVDDTVSGFIAALESHDGVGEVFNLGTNFEISIKDTVGLISNLMNSNIEIETSIERNRPAKSEVERLWADNSKARRVLNWEPKYSDFKGLSEGLKETIDWFINSDNLARYKSDIYNK